MTAMARNAATRTILAALAARGMSATSSAGAMSGAGRRALTQAFFNGAVRSLPLAVVPCADEAAIRSAIRIAADTARPCPFAPAATTCPVAPSTKVISSWTWAA